ncbi:MAG: hypothetical protein A2498_04115 [Lentisphaerae bacterium RIFOXYC12_FULL_60_16]|nr:MAG: hypothetical protein A2498_04115 [Lentisphaerae bacterium RIFOXYC12_FULL_60_16]OGV78646.1 MAG: hypothetical protein A2340_12780 [Lentisphaerae bacterium RIFOXYB12_FULL_60_10]
MKHLSWRILVGMAVMAASLAAAAHYRMQADRLRHERDRLASELEGLRSARHTLSQSISLPAPLQPKEPAVAAPAPIPAGELPPSPILTVDEPPPPPRERPRQRGVEWLETMRTNNPERYQAFQQARSNWAQSVQNAWAQKSQFFMSRDTSRMDDAEFEEYTRMVEVMNHTWALGQQLQQEGMLRDERRQVMSTVHSNLVVLAPLLENERDRSIRDLALGMGHTDQDALAFVSYVNRIVSNTSVRAILPGMTGRGGRPGPGEFFRVPSTNSTR